MQAHRREFQLCAMCRAQVGYGRVPHFHGDPVHVAAANLLDRQFDVAAPDTAWASGFTCIRAHEGWMYLAVVLDLFSRQIVGWAMRDQADTDMVLQAFSPPRFKWWRVVCRVRTALRATGGLSVYGTLGDSGQIIPDSVMS